MNKPLQEIDFNREKFEQAFPLGKLIYYDLDGDCYKPVAAHLVDLAKHRSAAWMGWKAVLLSQRTEQAKERDGCSSCDGSGDIHRADGEYIGKCPCSMSNDEVDIAKRLRRVVKQLGLGNAVPLTDGSLHACMFSVLGMVARKIDELHGWKPIETAPKDGTEFIARYTLQGNVKQLVSWNTIHGFWQSKDKSVNLMGCEWSAISADTMPRFKNVYCSQCGNEFGPGNEGFSDCRQHAAPAPDTSDEI